MKTVVTEHDHAVGRDDAAFRMIIDRYISLHGNEDEARHYVRALCEQADEYGC